MNKNKKTMIEVYRATGEMEAQVIKSLLESYGVHCILQSNAAPSVHVFTADGMGEVKVMVSDSNAEEAKRLIEGGANA